MHPLLLIFRDFSRVPVSASFFFFFFFNVLPFPSVVLHIVGHVYSSATFLAEYTSGTTLLPVDGGLRRK